MGDKYSRYEYIRRQDAFVASRKIDAEIMRVPAERSKNLYLYESWVALFGGAEEIETHLDNGWHLVIVPDHVPKEE